MSRARLGAALILLLALALRVWGLSAWSLDGDELYSWYDVQTILAGEPWPPGAHTFPLGYVLMAASAAALGPSALSLRLLPMLCAWGAVAALLLARRDVARPAARAVAALAAAISPWLLYHAQSARFYGPLLLFATLALLWCLPGLGRRPRLAWLALLLAALCHPTAALLAPALVVAQGDLRAVVRRLGGLALAALAAAGLLALMDDSPVHSVLAWWAEGADPGHYGALHYVLGLAYNLGPELGLLAVLGAGALVRARAPEARALLAAGLLPPALLLAAGLAGFPVYQRYALAAVPALLLLAGRGWLALPSPALRGLALALVLLLPAPRLAAHLVDGSRHDTRAVAAFLAAHAHPDDAFVLEQHATIELYLYEAPGFADIRTEEAPVGPGKRHDLARQKRDSWLALKAAHRGRPDEEAFHAWVDEVYTEVTRIGRPPWALVRHDNQYVIYRRAERLPPSPRPVPPDRPPPDHAEERR